MADKKKFNFVEPIKNIPTVLKTFPKGLINLWKEPVTNVAQVEQRKKDLWAWLYLFAGIAVLMGLLGGIVSAISAITSIFLFIGVAGIMYCGFLLFIAGKAGDRFKALTCEDCDTLFELENKEDFSKYVSYDIIKEDVTSNLSHPASENGVVREVTASGKASVIVEIKLTCPKCGKVRTLHYSIEPFKCERKETNVLVRDLAVVKATVETSVKEVVAMYKDPAQRSEIPYTIHSIHHPNHANRSKPQTGNSFPHVNGVKITYNRTVDELVKGYFTENELNGNLTVAG
ncbi:MAG: hypothetical protein IKK70_04820 [Clostridia bacterium]|nr:hypothetical protein [Clostridia bacterium]